MHMHLHIRSHTLAHIFDHGCHAVKLLTFQENEQQEESEEEEVSHLWHSVARTFILTAWLGLGE